MSYPAPGQPAGGFADLLGLRLLSAAADEVVAELDADGRHLDAAGEVHHGVHATLVETVASVGAWYAVRERRLSVVGIANHTDVLRAHGGGRLEARGRPEHVGADEQLWSVWVRRDDGEAVARGQVRLWHLPDERPAAADPGA